MLRAFLTAGVRVVAQALRSGARVIHCDLAVNRLGVVALLADQLGAAPARMAIACALMSLSGSAQAKRGGIYLASQ